MGTEGEISRFEDCEGCTDVKIEGVAQIEQSSEHDRGSTHHFRQNLSAKWLYLDLV